MALGDGGRDAKDVKGHCGRRQATDGIYELVYQASVLVANGEHFLIFFTAPAMPATEGLTKGGYSVMPGVKILARGHKVTGTLCLEGRGESTVVVVFRRRILRVSQDFRVP